MALPEGVYTFDPEKEPSGPRTDTIQGLTPAEQQFDDGSRNAAQQLTSEVAPWEHAPTPADIAAAMQAAQQSGQTVASAPTTVDEIGKLKKIIGDQGNTIGDLRKLLGSLTERITQTPNQSYYQSPQPVKLFQNREPGDFPTAAEIQQALITAGDVLYNSINQRIEEVAVQAQLSQAGVTPEEAALIKLEFPSISHLPAPERNAVIAAVLKAKRAEAGAAQAATMQQATQTAQAGVRQQVYVPQPQTVSNIPQAGAAINIDAFGNIRNSSQMETELRKLGIQRVNDIGRRG